MSWSLRLIGDPEKVAAALDKEGEKLTGQSRTEFDEVKPHLQAIVRANMGSMVDLKASGHASFSNTEGKKLYGSVFVELSQTHITPLV